ncbi:MAG: ATP-binding protein [Oligoflexales bacterium]
MKLIKFNEAVLHQILECSPDGLILVNQVGEIAFCNRRAEELFAYAKDELIGQPIEVLLPPRFVKGHTSLRKGYIASPQTRSMNSGKQLFGRKKDGSEFNVDITLSPIKTEEGTLIASSIRDISKKVKVDLELVKAKQASERANSAKSEFLANMSHEIRTPMNAIFGFADILESHLQDEKCLEYLRAIKTSGKTLLNLINDILDLSKIEAGKLELKYAPCQFESIITDIEKIFAQEISKKQLLFRVTIDVGLPKTLMLDDLRIRQILLNLVGNAVKFTEKGEIKIQVSMANDEKTDSSINLIIKVIDTGIGIPKGQLESIFDSFTQGQGSAVVLAGVGTGLGLSITKRLVSMMGGKIWAQSELGRGSTFNIALNGIEVSAISCEEPSSEESEIILGPAKVLIVDDLGLNRSLLREFLMGHNLIIYEACDGEEAIEIAKQEIPNLILMDLKMPKKDGFEASISLKRDPHTSHIPILVVTASVVNGMEGEVLKVCDEFIRKPVSRLKLLNIMKIHLPHTLIDRIDKELDPKNQEDQFLINNNVSEFLKKDLRVITDEKILSVEKLMLTEDIADLAAQICDIGKRHSFPPLQRIGEKLMSEVGNFEVEKLPLTINTLKKMVGRIDGV